MARFFTIVVPAHNEEAIIGETLRRLAELEYPKDRYEVIVVENGSKDETLARARRHEGGNVSVMSTEVRGVSHARNLGAKRASSVMDWCLFLDADTFLPPPFLAKLDAYLSAHPEAAYGTAKILSDRDTRTSRFWYWYTNVTDSLIGVMHRVHIVRRDLVEKVSYDETLHSMEDVKYGQMLAKHGKYFFLWDNPVVSSARRFEKLGYTKMFFTNLWRGVLGLFGERALAKRDWEVVRD